MKSEEELDAEIVRINQGDARRAASLDVLRQRGLLTPKHLTRLQIVQQRMSDVAEANAVPYGWLGKRARRNTKNALVDAVKKLDADIDQAVTKNGLADEVDELARGTPTKQSY